MAGLLIALGVFVGEGAGQADIAPPPSRSAKPGAGPTAPSSAGAPTPEASQGSLGRAGGTRSLFIVDTHADITQRLVYDKGDFVAGVSGSHLDLPKAQAGLLGGEFFSIFVYPKRTPREHWFDEAEHQMRVLREVAASSGGKVVVATTADEVRAARARGALAMLFGVEGGHMLGPGAPEDTQLDHLRRLHELGARYLTLTWAVSNDVGGSSGDDGDGTGLTPFGRKVMAEMERLGMMVDLSHVSDPLFWDALRAARRPVLLSHSSSRALANVPRNVTDAMARAVAAAAIEAGFDREVEPLLRPFFYLPFEHSESLVDQEFSVQLFAALQADTGDEESMKYALIHRDIIARFGRFPHRNAGLGRKTTDAEREFLDEGGFAG